MKTVRILAVVAGMAVLTAANLFADGNQQVSATTTDTGVTKPIQLALVPPVELVPENESISGLRLNIYGSNRNVFGVDIGLIHETKEDFHGIAFGLLSFVHGEARGLQLSGIYSTADKRMSGLQVGMVNRSPSMHGLQIGLANFADDMTGIQIGLWNEIKNKPSWNVIPIINAAF
jgi:hypothetical protein